MATDDPAATSKKANDAGGFRIANGPVVNLGEEDSGFALDLAQLPRSYGGPILVAIPRDPRTLFTYWSINWESIFAKAEPVDRRVYLRVLKTDGLEESESAVEPMLGTYYVTASEPAGTYRVELGYYQPAGTWRSVAISDSVKMPPEAASENLSVDVATVPFHLSFQRMIDLFRGSNGDSITRMLSRLQDRALTDDERGLLSPEEWEILLALDLSLSEVETTRRAFSDSPTADRLRKRAEAILGFGGTSPSGAFGPGSPAEGFGGSSWSSPSS
jgi:hypothetical protein